jgi:hypothetical protein
MKITKTITTEFEFDYDAEVKRLTDNFQGDQLQRQLSILNHFKNGDYDQMMDEYNLLPYDTDEECTEKEYVGWWFSVLYCGWNEYGSMRDFTMITKNMKIDLDNGVSNEYLLFYLDKE